MSIGKLCGGRKTGWWVYMYISGRQAGWEKIQGEGKGGQCREKGVIGWVGGEVGGSEEKWAVGVVYMTVGGRLGGR